MIKIINYGVMDQTRMGFILIKYQFTNTNCKVISNLIGVLNQVLVKHI